MQSRVVKISLIVLSIAVVLSVINFVISINVFSNNLLEKNLEKYTGLNFEFVEPKINLDHHLNLKTKARAVYVYSNDKTLKVAQIDNPDITIKPLGLIFKNINIDNFSADNITVSILRDENGY